MVLFVVLLLEIILLVELMRRVDRLSAAVLCIFYIVIGQVFMQYHAFAFSDDTFSTRIFSEYYYHTDKWTVFYFCVVLVIYISTFGLRNSPKPPSVSAEVRKLLTTPFIRNAYTILLVLLCIRFLTTDFDVLWKNYQYLLINSTSSLQIDNGITRLAKSLLGFSALIAGFALGGDIVARKKIRVLLGMILLAIYMLLPIGSASRSAILPMASVCLSLLAIGNRRHIYLAMMALLLGMTFFIMAQIARPTGEYGIAAIPNYFVLFCDVSADDLIKYTFGSIFQGFFITPESIVFKADHAIEYKILSFSPFPSALDGFSEILPLNEVRLHAFVPMSAVGEAFSFGVPYIILYMLTIAVTLRMNIKAANKKNRILFITTSALITIFFIASFSYPMRNVYRNILVVIVVLNARILFLSIWMLLHKENRHKRTVVPVITMIQSKDRND